MKRLYSWPQRSNRFDRGDTIVEVLFALAVLGAVLGSSYVVVSRNISNSQSSQERLEAIKIAESQLEKLKVKSSADETVLTQNDFCITSSYAISSSATANCLVDANGNPTSEYPRYRVKITNEASIAKPVGTRFKVNLLWENVSGNGNANFDFYYEVYKS